LGKLVIRDREGDAGHSCRARPECVPWNDSYATLNQKRARKVERAYVGIGEIDQPIKGALRISSGKPGRLQYLEEYVSALLEEPAARFYAILRTLQCRLRRNLGRRGRARDDRFLQFLGDLHRVRGADEPSEPPSGHRVRLRRA